VTVVIRASQAQVYDSSQSAARFLSASFALRFLALVVYSFFPMML
jgi:hypothetical protein